LQILITHLQAEQLLRGPPHLLETLKTLNPFVAYTSGAVWGCFQLG
jgi:hypothetical protein